MHGQRRADIPVLSAEKQEDQRQKVRLAFELLQRLLSQRASGLRTVDALHATRKLIEFNPELSTVWNYRREVLSNLLEQRQLPTRGQPPLHNIRPPCDPSSSKNALLGVSPGEANTGEVSADCSNSSKSSCSFCQHDWQLSKLLREELHLTTFVLTKGASKAYCLWLHRSWTLARLAAHEYARHVVHLSLSLSQVSQASPTDQRKEQHQRRQEYEKDQGQQQREHRACCRCCKAACLMEDRAPEGTAQRRCGLEGALSLLQEELHACEKIMKEIDGRNFHCWQHRSMVLVWQAAFLRYKRRRCLEGEQRRSTTGEEPRHFARQQ